MSALPPRPVSRRPASLRRDLALRLSLGLVLAWLAAVGGAGLALKARTDRIFDSALQETAERILPLAILEIEADRYRRDHDREDRRARRSDGGSDHDDEEDEDDEDDDHRPRVVPRTAQAAPHDEYLTYLLRDRAGAVLVLSHDADPEVFPPDAPEGFSAARDHRLYTRSAEGGRYTIQAAEPLAVRRSAMFATLGLMLLPLAALIPIALLGISWLVRRGLGPLDGLSAALGRRGAQDLSPVPDTGLPAELEPIRGQANRLMARMGDALAAERDFASNAAHELRTPIAATLAHTQRLVAEAPAGPLRERAMRVEGELKRMARLSEKLLQLARAEGGGVVRAAPGDVVPILAALADDIARDLPEGRVAVTLPEGAVASRLDPDAFAVLARNLIENALRHGAPGTPVAVTLTPAGVLRVENDAPPVAAEALARLTQRFERGGSRADGSGLGLTIAASIAAAIGSDLRLASPIPGSDRGFRAEVAVAAA
ncbi:ATP-binding protein [Paracoccus sanguinis]|uniref:ATP-binding protein n=1 Tax=Paracoccus sanguinis TaxID=1545044 RepID=UPI001452A1E7|nr:ATP-binding protein [Paracoccus sanguinis]QJD17853.1 two-component sensor histidine kinase [Paracoccus sanguinis]